MGTTHSLSRAVHFDETLWKTIPLREIKQAREADEVN